MFEQEPEIKKALLQLTDLLAENDTIRRFQKLQAQIAQHEGLKLLTEELKKAQKDAVQYAHYGKPEAERQAVRRADELKAQFDTHPLVSAYRESLAEANDLLHHLTDLIQDQVNHAIEEGQ